MRKLNKKNKSYIIILSVLTLILLGAILVFIGFKIKELNHKYGIALGSVVYDSRDELVYIKEDTYAKKDLLNRYYVMINNDKHFIGQAPVIFTSHIKELKLLGIFYEILKNGEVNKLKGETTINSTATSRIFKIDDRKYLVIAPSIKSGDGSLNASDYLLINIDKAGNGYLFNDEVNIKTFSDLSIITDGFTFNVNEELLIIDDESIDLAKINGSTNQYEKPEEEPGGSDDGGTGGNDGNQSETIYPEETPKPDPIIVDRYVTHKTTIMSINTTANSADIRYVVYDPFSEYKEVYFTVSKEGVEINRYNLEMALTKHTIQGLLADSEYRFDFYYSYDDEQGIAQNVLFDSILAQTKNINGNITLEKISNNSVRYILKIDSKYPLDSAKIAMYIDGELVATETVNTVAASKDGFVSTITYDKTGSFALLKLVDCIYNSAPVEIEASYKYKL